MYYVLYNILGSCKTHHNSFTDEVRLLHNSITAEKSNGVNLPHNSISAAKSNEIKTASQLYFFTSG